MAKSALGKWFNQLVKDVKSEVVVVDPKELTAFANIIKKHIEEYMKKILLYADHENSTKIFSTMEPMVNWSFDMKNGKYTGKIRFVYKFAGGSLKKSAGKNPIKAIKVLDILDRGRNSATKTYPDAYPVAISKSPAVFPMRIPSPTARTTPAGKLAYAKYAIASPPKQYKTDKNGDIIYFRYKVGDSMPGIEPRRIYEGIYEAIKVLSESESITSKKFTTIGRFTVFGFRKGEK